MEIERKFIGQIEKNTRESIKAHVHEWKGNWYLDLRVFYRPKNAESGEDLPTKKGFRLNYELLDDLIALLTLVKEKLESEDDDN